MSPFIVAALCLLVAAFVLLSVATGPRGVRSGALYAWGGILTVALVALVTVSVIVEPPA